MASCEEDFKNCEAHNLNIPTPYWYNYDKKTNSYWCNCTEKYYWNGDGCSLCSSINDECLTCEEDTVLGGKCKTCDSGKIPTPNG